MTVRPRLLPTAVAVAAAAPSSEARPPRPVSTAVGVAAREFRLSVYRARVPVGEVRFNLSNRGEDVHDLVVRDSRGRIRGRSSDVKPGGRSVVAIRLGRGTYRLSCDVADHAARGMRATVKVVR